MYRILFPGLLIVAGFATLASAQQPAQQQSLAASLNVYVFPSDGQAPDRQSRDESECFQWAVANTGVDPFALTKQTEAQKQQAQQQQQQVQQSTQGAAAKGALGGAAAGALIGDGQGIRLHDRRRMRRRLAVGLANPTVPCSGPRPQASGDYGSKR